MRGTRRFGVALACAVALGACGGSDGEVAVETPTTATTAPPTTTTTRPPPREGCVPGLLAVAAEGQFRAATVTDQACSSTFAIATIDGPTTDPVVGYFQIGDDGRWVLVATGDIDGDQYADRPPGLIDALVANWRRAYTARAETEAEQARIEAEAEAARQAALAEQRRLEEEARLAEEQRLALETIQRALEEQATSTTTAPPPPPAP
jgi:hypothetical protein